MDFLRRTTRLWQKMESRNSNLIPPVVVPLCPLGNHYADHLFVIRQLLSHMPWG